MKNSRADVNFSNNSMILLQNKVVCSNLHHKQKAFLHKIGETRPRFLVILLEFFSIFLSISVCSKRKKK